MNLIAIETSTDICSIAYFSNRECIAVVEDIIPRAHAEKLPLFYEQLIGNTDFDLNNLDGVAISIGPGSFTGLRIGLSYGKGLAYSHNLPIIPVPTLMAFIYGVGKINGKIKVLMHSHGDNVFHQDFVWNNDQLKADTEASVTLWTDLKLLPNQYGTVLHWKCEQLLSDDGYSGKITAVHPSAKGVGYLAINHFSRWVMEDPKQLVPNYIAPFVIKRKSTGSKSRRN